MSTPDSSMGRAAMTPQSREMMSRKVWLFDLDGTLVDSSPGVIRAFHVAQMACGETPAREAAIRRRIGYPLMETVAQLSEVAWDDFLPHFRREAMATMHHDTRVLPGVTDLLLRLEEHGSRMAVVTSKRADNARLILDHLHLAEFFDALIGSDSVRCTKPDPEPVRAALDLLGVEPKAAVMVGDTAADIEAAHGAGVPVVVVRSGFETRGRLRGADLEVADAVALCQIFDAVLPSA